MVRKRDASGAQERVQLEQLELKVGYIFRNRALLQQALTHKSYGNENPGEGNSDNERLEFLGDAVLGLIVGHLLIDRCPLQSEGELSMMRAQIVHEKGLARVAIKLDLGQWLYLGKGELRSGGRAKSSILADACEALIAAVYLDGGYIAAFETVKALFAEHLENLDDPGSKDFKTRFQQRAQAVHRFTPRYEVIGQTGPDHQKMFEVAVRIDGVEYGRAAGSSKKEAEQSAAQIALAALEKETSTMPS